MLPRTLIKLGDSLVVSIPAPYVRLLGWYQGDALQVEIRGHEIVVVNQSQSHTGVFRGVSRNAKPNRPTR